MTDWTVVQVGKVPAAAGPCAPGVAAGGPVFCAEPLPIDPASGTVPDGVEAQTRRSLPDLGAVPEAGGASVASVVEAAVSLKDMGRFAAAEAVHSTFFPDSPPAPSSIEVARLPRDVLVEVEAGALRRAGA